MAQTAPLTNGEVTELVYTWFRKITDKCPLEEMEAMLSTDGLEMKFPEKTLRNYGDFKEWYEGVTNLFFNQVHDIKFLGIDLAGDKANLNVIVNWQAQTWKAPAARSEWQGVYAHQNWVVTRDPRSGQPVIQKYYVNAFDPMKP